MRTTIFIVGFVILSSTLFSQEYKKVYKDIKPEALEQMFREKDITYEENEYGYSISIASIPIGVLITEGNNIKMSSVVSEEVDLTSYILNKWNREHPEMLAYTRGDEDQVVITSNVKCYGGVTAKHILLGLSAFSIKFENFKEKYVPK